MILGAILFLIAALTPLAALAQGSSTNAIKLDPGIASTPGTYNSGSQTAINGRRISPQIWYEGHASSCTLNSTCGSSNDAGKLLTATAAGVTFAAPNPGAVGTASYPFGYDNVHPYTITTVGHTATIYGCGTAGTSVTLAVQVQLITDGTNWQCVPGGIGVSVLPNNSILGQNSGGGGQQALTPAQVTAMLAGTSGPNFGTLSASKTDSGNNIFTGRNVTPHCPITDASTIALDLSQCVGTTGAAPVIYTLAMTAAVGNSRTINLSNIADGQFFELEFTQDAIGGRSVILGTGFATPGGIQPILSTTANAVDSVGCYSVNTSVAKCNPPTLAYAAPVGWTFVNKVANSSADTNNVTTGAVSTTGANLIVVSVGAAFGSPTLTDSASNSWGSPALSFTNSASKLINVYFLVNPATSGTHTFTASSNGAYPSIAVLAYKGPSSPTIIKDVSNGASGSGLVTTLQPGSITPAAANELVVTSLTNDNPTSTPTVNSGFAVQNFSNANSGQSTAIADAVLITSGTTTLNPAWTFSSTNANATIIAFRP